MKKLNFLFESNLKWLRFSFKNIFRNRRRSIVTITVAALGTAAILLAGGFAHSSYEGLAQSAARSTGHLIIGQALHFTNEEEVPLQYGIDNANQIKTNILSDPSVRYVLPRVNFNGLVGNGDKTTIMLATGIDPDAEFAIKGPFIKVVAGEILQANLTHPQVMIGEGLARNLKARVGNDLTLFSSTKEGVLNALDVKVRGIVSTGVADLDKRLLYTDIETAQKLLNTDRVSSLGVFLNAMSETSHAQERIARLLPQLRVVNWEDQAAFYHALRSLYNRIFGALGAILCFIVVFVIGNAMALAIIERTREIGTLRAMGTFPRQLIQSFAFEGMFLGALGALGGTALAIVVSVALMIFPVDMPPPPGNTRGYPLLISLQFWMVISVIVGIVLLSSLSSGFVASRTMKQSVVTALAHT